MLEAIRTSLTDVDVVALKQIEEAEDQGSPVPQAFVDTLVRLAQVGYVRGDSARVVKVTPIGRQFLRSAPAIGSNAV